jgi:hypothetical protein
VRTERVVSTNTCFVIVMPFLACPYCYGVVSPGWQQLCFDSFALRRLLIHYLSICQQGALSILSLWRKRKSHIKPRFSGTTPWPVSLATREKLYYLSTVLHVHSSSKSSKRCSLKFQQIISHVIINSVGLHCNTRNSSTQKYLSSSSVLFRWAW